MADLFLERAFDPPMTPDGVLDMAALAADCFLLHRVDWRGSLLSLDGTRMICWFHAPDAESPRIALRQTGADTRVLWPGTVHDGPSALPMHPGGVVVTRRFDSPVTVASIQAIEDAGAWCLEAHHVRFVRTFCADNGRRMVCLYRAPDAESVRLAQRQAGLPVENVWSYRFVEAPER